MGYWNIKCDKCGKYLWDENTDLVREMEVEWDSGYKEGVQDCETVERMQEKIDALEALLGANVRVIKEEIRKELATTKEADNENKQERNRSAAPNPPSDQQVP